MLSTNSYNSNFTVTFPEPNAATRPEGLSSRAILTYLVIYRVVQSNRFTRPQPI